MKLLRARVTHALNQPIVIGAERACLGLDVLGDARAAAPFSIASPIALASFTPPEMRDDG